MKIIYESEAAILLISGLSLPKALHSASSSSCPSQGSPETHAAECKSALEADR